MSAASDVDAWQREVILRNAAKDPHYAPYCLRCKGLVRLRARRAALLALPLRRRV